MQSQNPSKAPLKSIKTTWFTLFFLDNNYHVCVLIESLLAVYALKYVVYVQELDNWL